MAKTKFRPLHDRVVVRRVESEAKTAGGIIIPDTAKEKPQEGEVIAVGPGARDAAGKLLINDGAVAIRGGTATVANTTLIQVFGQGGNDLITPRPQLRFTGLKPGDRWCVCALRWREAYEAGHAPPVVLESTHERALDYVLIEWLRKRAVAPTGAA